MPVFLKSAAAPADFTDDVGREVAFVGRSNSGKSTAINLLTGITKLARVSKTPGRTQLINFFEVGTSRRLVDLPGYGFARVAPGTRDHWRRLIEAYLTQRSSLVAVVVTLDIRRGITELDDDLLRWLRALDLPVGLLLTKADKLSRGAGLAREQEVRRDAGDAAAKLTRLSSLTRDGVEQARAWLAEWLDLTDPATPPREISDDDRK
jgi:GTP-binding protein